MDSTFDPIHFVALGDGGTGLPSQKAVADKMINYYEREQYHTVVLLGDNIYPNGNAIKYGEEKFTRLYAPLIDKGIDFKPVLGNHDIGGPLGYGVLGKWHSYQEENQRFFNMPGPYYTFKLGPCQFFMLNTNRFSSTQREWLQTQLASATTPWKIVCGHHPVYSSGMHGPSQRLKKKLQPILAEFQVPLYLAGHEHDYERFAPIDGVHHVISGGGGARIRQFKKPRPHSRVRHAKHHFLSCQLKKTAKGKEVLTVKALSHKEELIDSFRISLS